MTENSRKVFDFLHDNYGTKLTNRDIADALGVSYHLTLGQ